MLESNNMLSYFCFTAIGFNVETVTYKNLKFQGEEELYWVWRMLLSRTCVVSDLFDTRLHCSSQQVEDNISSPIGVISNHCTKEYIRIL